MLIVFGVLVKMLWCNLLMIICVGQRDGELEVLLWDDGGKKEYNGDGVVMMIMIMFIIWD